MKKAEPACGSDLSTLLSATLYLLSMFCANGCPRVAIMVEEHLALLAAHGEAAPALRNTSERLLAMHWQAAADSARQALARPAMSTSQPGYLH